MEPQAEHYLYNTTEQTNDEIVHLDGLREADGLVH